MKFTTTLPNLGILTALASSLCCIMPVLAIVAGTSGIASTFSWIEPARPYFIGASVLILGFAWYQKLKPQQMDNCGCPVAQKAPFMQSKIFLSLVTLLSVLLLALPYYSPLFFPKKEKNAFVSPVMSLQKAEFTIDGMTCSACENHLQIAINKLNGIAEVVVSYDKGNAIVAFDKDKTAIDSIVNAINSTGYTALKNKIL